jgi:hypothetical protein
MFQSNMSDEKLTHVVKDFEISTMTPEERELVRLGGELEALERNLGIWESCKLYKVALLYGMLSYSLFSPLEKVSRAHEFCVVFVAYSCAAVYVREIPVAPIL